MDHSRGFTLIELILAMTITTIMITGTTMLFMDGVARRNEAIHEALATDAATTQIEQLRAADYNSIVPDAVVNFAVAGIPRQTMARYEISLPTGETDLKKVLVKIRWMEGAREQQFQQTTYIARYGLNHQ